MKLSIQVHAFYLALPLCSLIAIMRLIVSLCETWQSKFRRGDVVKLAHLAGSCLATWPLQATAACKDTHLLTMRKLRVERNVEPQGG